MSRFPKNLRSIYSADKFRDYCLHPMGIKIETPYMKKPQQNEGFVNYNVKLHRTDKPLGKNTFALKIFNNKELITKPELRQYLEKIYGLDVQDIHTVNYMGKIGRNHLGRVALRNKDFKKAYVELNGEIDPAFQKLERGQ